MLCWRAVHTVLLKRLARGPKKGAAPGAAHSNGSPTEARNADAGLSHMLAEGNVGGIS